MTINQPEITYTGTHAPPCYATHQSAGFDLRAEITQHYTLYPGERHNFPTGIYCKLPGSFELQVRSRSGLAYKHGVCVLGDPGTVDADYRGEVKVLLINHSNQPYTVQPGERIAQAVIGRYVVVAELLTDATVDRTGGHGSTGTK